MYNLPARYKRRGLERQVRWNREFHAICNPRSENRQTHVPSVYLAAKFSFRGLLPRLSRWWPPQPPLLERPFQFPLPFTRVELWKSSALSCRLKVCHHHLSQCTRTVFFFNIRVFRRGVCREILEKSNSKLSRVSFTRELREEGKTNFF